MKKKKRHKVTTEVVSNFQKDALTLRVSYYPTKLSKSTINIPFWLILTPLVLSRNMGAWRTLDTASDQRKIAMWHSQFYLFWKNPCINFFTFIRNSFYFFKSFFSSSLPSLAYTYFLGHPRLLSFFFLFFFFILWSLFF